MQESQQSILKKVKPVRIILPVVIGLAVVVFMFIKEFDPSAFTGLRLTGYSILFLFIAFLMMLVRDIGYIIRIRILSSGDLSWKQAFNIIMLWEFSSAVTPSAIGGTSVAMFFLYKEGINFGRSSAIVMATSFLDELYFILFFPLLFFIVGSHTLFFITGNEQNILFSSANLMTYAIVGYCLKFLFTCLVSYGLFFNPRGLKWLILKMFKFSFLRKWRFHANDMGSDLVNASKELKKKSFFFWIKAFLATFFSWTARYWVVNFLLLGLIFGMPLLSSEYSYSFFEHLIIFARQLVMWIMMIIMPSPGASGFSEYIFDEYLGEFIPVAGLVAMMALLWRFVTYYPYLIMGILIIPHWIKNKFGKN